MKPLYTTETAVLNFLEAHYQTVWTPIRIAQVMFAGHGVTTRSKLYRSVLRALRLLYDKKHVDRLIAAGSNQSVYWLRSRINVPAEIDQIPF